MAGAPTYVIAMIIVGFVVLAAFAAYEIWLAPVHRWLASSMDWLLQVDLVVLRTTLHLRSRPYDPLSDTWRLHWLHRHVRGLLPRCWQHLHSLCTACCSGLGRPSSLGSSSCSPLRDGQHWRLDRQRGVRSYLDQQLPSILGEPPRLPEAELPNLALIYEDLTRTTQLS